MGTIMKNGKTYSTSPSLASDIVYDNSGNNLPGTVQTAIDEVYNRPVNNNLLINSNFANPVNQRGITSKELGSASTYTIDRWKALESLGFAVSDNCIELSRADGDSKISFLQIIEDPLLGKTVTFSAKLYGIDDIISVTGTIPNSPPDTDVKVKETPYINGVTLSILLYTNGLVGVRFVIQRNTTVKIEWAKLELGEVATPYVPRLYGEEWLLCQRYYQIIDVGNSSCHGGNSDALVFVLRPHVKMRDVGTPIDNGIRVKKDNASQSGFTITFTNCNALVGFVTINARKESHGVTYANYPNISGTISLDAEL